MLLHLLLICPALAASLTVTPHHNRGPSLAPQLLAHRAAAPILALPSTAALATASTIPTLLGFWKSEYGVSYAYGFAMAAAGAMHLSNPSPLAVTHAACLLAYGSRLNLFLLYRELAIPRFREFREKIEARAVSKGGRLARTPFVLSCSLLYFCMAAPVLLTARHPPAAGTPAALCLTALLALMYLGFGVAALGDLTKTWVKAQKGEDALVTSGLFRWLRHPNYTGEACLWSANAAAAVTVLAGAQLTLFAKARWLVAALTGAAGIGFVLMGAAGSLEAKQAERYADDPLYKAWVAGSWGGPKIAKKAPPAAAEGGKGSSEASGASEGGS